MTTTTIRPMNLSNVIDSFFAPGACRAHADAPSRRVPRAEVLESDKDYIIRMDLPGVNRENLEIEIEDRALTVKATRSTEVPEGYRAIRNERADTEMTYQRAFSLGRGIKTTEVAANLEFGTLTLTLPKSEQSLPRKIEVK